MKKIKISILLTLSILFASCSFGKKPMNQSFLADISAFAYLPYPTMDIIVDDLDYGVGSGDLTTDVEIRSGTFYVYWHDAGTGKEYKSLNTITIPPQPNKSTIVIHIYPTNEAEVVFTNDWPLETSKGLKYRQSNKTIP